MMNLADFLVLGVLAQCGPCGGYDVVTELRSRCVDMWTDMKTGSIYHSINKMSRSGHIKKTTETQTGSRPTKTLFVITESGERYFDKLQEEAFGGLYPKNYGFLVGLVFNTRRTPEEINAFITKAIMGIDQRLISLEEYQYNHRSPDPEHRQKIDQRISIYLKHTELQLKAERDWLLIVRDNLNWFNNRKAEVASADNEK